MVDPVASVTNLAQLAALGGLGRYGYYEALDYTRSRLPEGERFAIVRAYMAHHLGMTLCAIANVLHDGRLRARFNAAPIVLATELLLQERTPRDVSVSHPRAEEVTSAARISDTVAPVLRQLQTPHDATPQTHLVSNGRYAVMLTAAGSGFSRWGDMALTRWIEDATCDACGSYFYLRDADSGRLWSTGYQPSGVEADRCEVTFTEDRAEFVRVDGTMTTTLEVLVSPEDDTEVRRISLTNNSNRVRNIEITSYSELVLALPAADLAHPAFSKMFVQTEYVEKPGRCWRLVADARRPSRRSGSRSTRSPKVTRCGGPSTRLTGHASLAAAAAARAGRGARRSAAVEYRGHSARSHLCAAPPGAHSCRWHGADCRVDVCCRQSRQRPADAG
jgi:cyclic beta-1,2-glucan synthetase